MIERGRVDHTAIEDLSSVVQVQPGAVVSKVIYRDATINATVFAFDAGEGLTEHTAARPAILEVVRGRLELTVDGTTHDAGPGFWLHMRASVHRTRSWRGSRP